MLKRANQLSKRSVLGPALVTKKMYWPKLLPIYWGACSSGILLHAKFNNINTLGKGKEFYFSVGVYLLCEATVEHNAQVV